MVLTLALIDDSVDFVNAVAEILALPDRVFPVAGLCVGYPAVAGHISMRLPLKVTVHTDKYADSHLGEAADGYDRRRDARHSLPRWRLPCSQRNRVRRRPTRRG